jgi:hypothetical protein
MPSTLALDRRFLMFPLFTSWMGMCLLDRVSLAATGGMTLAGAGLKIDGLVSGARPATL